MGKGQKVGLGQLRHTLRGDRNKTPGRDAPSPILRAKEVPNPAGEEPHQELQQEHRGVEIPQAAYGSPMVPRNQRERFFRSFLFHLGVWQISGRNGCRFL